MPRGYDDGRRAACLMVPMRAVRARPLVARCDRVELCRRCDLGVCHHLGASGTGWWADVEMLGTRVESIGFSYSEWC